MTVVPKLDGDFAAIGLIIVLRKEELAASGHWKHQRVYEELDSFAWVRKLLATVGMVANKTEEGNVQSKLLSESRWLAQPLQVSGLAEADQCVMQCVK